MSVSYSTQFITGSSLKIPRRLKGTNQQKVGMFDQSETQGRKLLNSATKSAMDRFGPAIYPIYAFREYSPEFIGTCFGIAYRGRKFLVTAAHVMDNHREAQLAVGVSTGMYSIVGDFFTVKTPQVGRDEDPFDFAWQELNSEDAKNFEVIASDDIDISNVPPSDKKAYTAIGYPLSKNKKIRPNERQQRNITPKRVQYSDFRVDAVEYFKHRGMTLETHIAIKRDNRAIDADGREGNTIGLKGMSGGPLIDIGLRAPDGQLSPQKVAGILIEHNDKETIIVAVRLGLVLLQIDKAINDQSSP
jgi:hypothetical protein